MIQSIDIEHFITEFLKLKIEYTSFAESDSGKIGFLADGQTPLLIYQDGRIIPFIFPKDTIVLDKFLLAEKEQEYNKLFCNPYNAAKYGYIDDVIEPRNTRFRVIRALQQLATKKVTNPAKKHGNIPL